MARRQVAGPAVSKGAADVAAKLIYTAHRAEQHGPLMLAAAVELDAVRAERDRLKVDVDDLLSATTRFVRDYRTWAVNPGEGYDALIDLCEDVVAKLERVI